MEDNKNQNNKISPPIKPNQDNKISPPVKSNIRPNLPNGVNFTNTIQTKPMTKFEQSSDKKNTTIVKQEKINKKTTKPLSTKIKIITSVVAIVVVLSLLTGLIYLAFIKPYTPMDISINFSADMNFISNGSSGDGATKKVMPGDDLDLSYVIKSESIEGEASYGVYVRITAYAICEDNYYGNIFSISFVDNNWYVGNDGYYYYKGVLQPDSTIDSVKAIHINEQVGSEFASKTVKVCIVAEALQAGNGSAESIWPTAPQEWLNIVKN